jgi:hypothetical protein
LDGRLREIGDALLDLNERPLRQPHRTGDVREADDLRVEVERPPVRLSGPREVFLFLREAGERSGRPRERVGPGAIAVRKLRGLPIAWVYPKRCACVSASAPRSTSSSP